MASNTYRLSSAYAQAPLHRRASGLLLALAVNVLLVIALLGVGVRSPAPKPSDTLIVDLIPEARQADAQPDRTVTRQPAETRLTRTRPPPPRVLVERPPPERPIKLDMIELSRADYRAADIGTMPKSASSAAGTAMASAGDSAVVGRGPNGETLYAAEWARRPTDAELAGYMPRNAPEGWGLVACRTVPGNRVEDCVELDNYPRGSRLAAAVRQAAWQFRVKPPRRNGKPLIGEWVRIRIEYKRSKGEG